VNWNIKGLERGNTLAQVYVNTIGWDRVRPEKALWIDRKLGCIQIMDLCARTGLVDINSNQGEGSLVDPPVGPSEDSLHEAHI
jgi:hypothetical protein